MTAPNLPAVYEQPRTPEQRYDYASRLSTARTLPGELRGSAADVLLRIEYGIAVGIPPVSALTAIHVIEGKPSASAGLISALLRTVGRLRILTEDDPAFPGEVRAVATFVRHDDPDHEYRVEWGTAEALKAGTLERKPDGSIVAAKARSPWATYRRSMLKARAVTEIGRDAAEDVLLGIRYTPEELGAQVNEAGDPLVIEGEVVVDRPAPPRPPAGPAEGPAAVPAPEPAAAPVVDEVVDAEVVPPAAPAPTAEEAVDGWIESLLASWDAMDVDALGAVATAARAVFPLPTSEVVHPLTGESTVVGVLLREVKAAITSGTRMPGSTPTPPPAGDPDNPTDPAYWQTTPDTAGDPTA